MVQGDTLVQLKTPPTEGFDVVFIDPPFRKGLAQACIDGLNDQAWLNEDALVYVETEREHPPLNLPGHWLPLKEKQAGQVTYRLYRVERVEAK